jgi:valine--pyruvate aminotransferase
MEEIAMNLSRFGKKITRGSGISQLMADLGRALFGHEEMLMLGGGNPAHIPQVQQRFRECMRRMLDQNGVFERAIGNYDGPQGNMAFIEALVALFRQEFGWDITPANIALTNGSQTAFFILFNIFGGTYQDGSHKKILLPLAPEYIGYADVGLEDDLFLANKPNIELLENHLFKYHINFETLRIDGSIGAVCVSRPTNPTGNVLTDSEIARLSALAAERGVPLIVDNAYGVPFPHIIFTDAHLTWNPNTILCMSLSKLGLPAFRTGIIVAREDIVRALSEANAVMSLAPTGMGAAIAGELVKSGEILDLSREIIRPYYENKARRAVEQLQQDLEGLDYRIHKPEGAIFLWLWFPGLSITADELYERLKRRGCLIVPGHYFFPGLDEPWRHKDECIRITYSQEDKVVTAGLKIIAEEVRRAYAG